MFSSLKINVNFTLFHKKSRMMKLIIRHEESQKMLDHMATKKSLFPINSKYVSRDRRDYTLIFHRKTWMPAHKKASTFTALPCHDDNKQPLGWENIGGGEGEVWGAKIAGSCLVKGHHVKFVSCLLTRM